MKKFNQILSSLIVKVSLILILSGGSLFGQAPSRFSYQAVLRDQDGNPRENYEANIQISILQGSATGSVVYSETHSTTTNAFGLVNLEIGSKNPANFSLIDWANGPYYVKIFVDGTEMGTNQLLSVPYALYAADGVGEQGIQGIQGEKGDLGPQGLQGIPGTTSWSGITDKPTTIAGYGITDADKQELSVSGEQLSISGGNSVNLPTTYNSLSASSSLIIGTSGVSFNGATELTGTTDATNNYISICLPSGYSAYNTRVLAVEIISPVSTGPVILNWTSYYGLGYVGTNGTVGYYLNWSRFVVIGSCFNSIIIYYPDELKGHSFRIFLFKVTIP
jgi:hypothetical protein